MDDYFKNYMRRRYPAGWWWIVLIVLAVAFVISYLFL